MTIEQAGCPARRAVAVAMAALTALVFGCGPQATEEGRDPQFQKAKKLVEMRDYAGAAGCYEKVLMANPQLAQAHFELGLLYDDKLADPISAIYHYRRYLALRPDSSQRQLVEDFMERAKLSLASKLPQSSVVDPGELTRLQTERATLMQENSVLKAKLAELEGRAPPTASGQAPRPSPGANGSAGAEPSSLPVVAPAAQPAQSRTHLVQKGDTLQSLALHYYGTRSAWEKIFQANRNALASKDQLKIGQELVIP